jgi:phosphoserine phosphatase
VQFLAFEKSPAFVFDFDGTIIEEVADLLFAKRLGIVFGEERWTEFWKMVTLFHTVTLDEALTRLSKEFATALTGLHQKEVLKEAEQIQATFREEFKSVYTIIHDKCELYVLTASSTMAVKSILNERYRHIVVHGLDFETFNGTFNGKHSSPMTPFEKNRTIRDEISKKHDPVFFATDSKEELSQIKANYSFLLDHAGVDAIESRFR